MVASGRLRSEHSQIRRTLQPAARNCLLTRRSRLRLPSSFAFQNAFRVAGAE
jgi:hypothetical protein